MLAHTVLSWSCYVVPCRAVLCCALQCPEAQAAALWCAAKRAGNEVQEWCGTDWDLGWLLHIGWRPLSCRNPACSEPLHVLFALTCALSYPPSYRRPTPTAAPLCVRWALTGWRRLLEQRRSAGVPFVAGGHSLPFYHRSSLFYQHVLGTPRCGAVQFSALHCLPA